MTYSTAELVALAITPKITASISIPCSIFIIREVRRDHVRGRGRAIDRVIAGMNTVDILASLGWFFSTWLVPKGSENTAFSAGNTQTCVLQGFLLQIAIGAPLYNCSLSIFYLLTVRYRWSDERLKRIELWVHASVIAFALGTGLLGIPLKLYNHIGTVCWVIGSPQGCGNSGRQHSDVSCDRGDYSWIYGVALFYGPLWVCVILTVIAMILIYLQVRNTARRTESYSFTPRRGSLLMSFQDTLRRKANIPTDEVALQAILYSISFFLTWTPSTIWSIAHWFGFSAYWLELLASICEPLQGFWNFFVFLRPRRSLRVRIGENCERMFCCFRRIKYPSAPETDNVLTNKESMLVELGDIYDESTSAPPMIHNSDDKMDLNPKETENETTGSTKQQRTLEFSTAATTGGDNNESSDNTLHSNLASSATVEKEKETSSSDDNFLDDIPVEEKREIEAIS